MLTQKRLIEAVAENRGWFTLLGIIFVVGGAAALLFPFASSIAVEVVVGISMVAVGAATFVHAFGVKDWGGFALQLVCGGVYLLAGAIMLANPVKGTLALTLVAGLAFVADGITRSILSFQLKPETGWSWMLLGGVVGILVGVMLFAQFPFSGAWALGVLAGINLLFAGWGFIMLAAAADDVRQEIPGDGKAAA